MHHKLPQPLLELDLGFTAEVQLEEGLRQLVRWWQPLREEIAAGRSVGVS